MARRPISWRLIAMTWGDVLQKYAFFIMQDYLTNVWGLSFTHAAGILNIWDGIQRILPFFIFYLLEEFIGFYKLGLMLFTITNSTIGLAFIAMSTPPVLASLTGTCKQYESKCTGNTQKILFYLGLAFIAIGKAGRKANVIQGDVGHKVKDRTESTQVEGIASEASSSSSSSSSEEEEAAAANMGTMESLMGIFVSLSMIILPRALAVAFPKIKLWSVTFGVPAIVSVVATCCYFSALRSFGKNSGTTGSPVTAVLRVFLASTLKITQKSPKDVKELYMLDDDEALGYTPSSCFWFLEKAAIEKDQQESRWKLCTVWEVEEVKLAIRLVPMCIPS